MQLTQHRCIDVQGPTDTLVRGLRHRHPTFGKAALSSIDALAVRSWLAMLQGQGMSATTRAKAYRLLSRILGAALEAGYLLRNPCTVKGAGQERAPEMRFAIVAQVAALAEAIGPRYRALVLVAAYGAALGRAGRPAHRAGRSAAWPGDGG